MKSIQKVNKDGAMSQESPNIRQFIDETFGNVLAAAVAFNRPLPTVKSWYYGRKAPRPLDAKKIVDSSKGALTWGGVYSLYCEKQAEREAGRGH